MCSSPSPELRVCVTALCKENDALMTSEKTLESNRQRMALATAPTIMARTFQEEQMAACG